jgi:hypothetical protein
MGNTTPPIDNIQYTPYITLYTTKKMGNTTPPIDNIQYTP